MGKHSKVEKDHVSKIQKWIAEDHQARQKAGRKTWDHQKDIICKWNVYHEKIKKLDKRSNKKVDKVEPRIKRFIKFADGTTTWQRLNIKFYREFLSNNKELENLCIYLNGLDPVEVRAGLKYKLKEAYIPRTHVLKFFNLIKSEYINDDKKDIETQLNNWIRYSLNWFQAQTPKVENWKKLERKWGKSLINVDDGISDKDRVFPKGELRSKNTIIRIIWMTNKFMQYLHETYPNKYPPTEFNPISKSQFRQLLKLRKGQDTYKQRRAIDSKTWKRIKTAIKDDPQLSILQLCWEFGLRRSEVTCPG
jgi:hypothetical protein